MTRQFKVSFRELFEHLDVTQASIEKKPEDLNTAVHDSLSGLRREIEARHITAVASWHKTKNNVVDLIELMQILEKEDVLWAGILPSHFAWAKPQLNRLYTQEGLGATADDAITYAYISEYDRLLEAVPQWEHNANKAVQEPSEGSVTPRRRAALAR